MEKGCFPLVLVIDDDDTLRFMAVTALEGAGYTVVEAADAADVVGLCEAHRPDIILLDVMMPGVDGFTACARLRESQAGRYVPVLMMTGLEDIDSVVKAYEAGATDFINKPLNYTLLSYRLQYMLRSKRNSDDLRASRSLLVEAQHAARLGYWESDPDGRIVAVSESIPDTLGLATDEQPDQLETLLRNVHAEDRAVVSKTITAALVARKPYQIEHRLDMAAGGQRTVLQQARWLDRGDGRMRMLGIVQDITPLRQAEQKAEELAFYDPVTRLPNRALMLRRLSEALLLARRTGRSIAVMFVDLDNFQRVNTSLGYEAGNRLIRQAGNRLRDCIRATDQLAQRDQGEPMIDIGSTVAKLAGDEFSIVLTHIDEAEDAARVARRLRDTFNAPFDVDGQDVVLSLSIGISVTPDDGEDAESLVRAADTALDHAKKAGRDCYHFYQASMNARAFARFSMELHLRRALEENELALHLQPKIDVASNRCTGMEVLLRWEHPELGRVSPLDFIPVAEETGLIIPIGEWILAEACRMTRELHDAGFSDLVCAVNLSAVQFRSTDLHERIALILRRTALAPEALELELTESLLMEDTGAAMEMLNSLRELRLSLAIDDFGTGFSSLSYLKKLPVNTLKIDQSFVRELEAGNDDAAIVSAVVAMAHRLRLKVVAEGVETQAQMGFLREQGCDQAQGYLFAAPMPFDQFAQWLRSNRSQEPGAAPGLVVAGRPAG